MDESCCWVITVSWWLPELIVPSSGDSCSGDTLLMDPPPAPDSPFPDPGLGGFSVLVVDFVVEVVVEVVVVFVVVVLVFVSVDVVFDFSPPKNTFQSGTCLSLSSCMPRG